MRDMSSAAMPEVIDLLSSDPPLPEKPGEGSRPQKAPGVSLPAPPKPQFRIDPISSDSADVSSLFNFDDTDKPPKKRRLSREKRSPLRRTASALESTAPDLSFNWSDDDFLLPPSNPAVTRKQRARSVEDTDPIITSSAPQAYSKPTNSVSRITIPELSDIVSLDDDDDLLPKPTAKKPATQFTQDSIEEFSDPFSIPGFAGIVGIGEAGNSGSNAAFSSKTAALLNSIGEQKKSAGTARRKTAADPLGFSDFSDGLDEPVAPKRPAKKSTKMTTEEKDAKAKARAEVRAQKDQERQLEKERKQKVREDKAKQKQLAADLADVNKLKVDKKESTPEMILDMASSMEETSVGNQAVEFMKRLGVEHTFFESPIPNVVKWRRKMNAKYNETAGHWEPCPAFIAHEKHVLCVVPAQEFVDMVITTPDEDERDTLELHVQKIKSAYPDHKVIYLIEGLTLWMRKNQNSRNRAYQAEVLSQFEQPAAEPPTTARGRGRKKKNKPETTPPVDDDTIEDALLNLQVAHACLIHHVNVPAESAEWIMHFTEHVSTIPYRREQMEGNDSAFCMDAGQVKAGDDKLDTFVKMLGEVNRVTASMAYGITSQYASVTDLVRGMRMHGPTMLEDVRKSANKNGALSDARVGPAASKRLHKVFTGLDPSSTDI